MTSLVAAAAGSVGVFLLEMQKIICRYRPECIICVMRNFLAKLIMALLLMASPLAAEDDEVPGFSPYMGLSVPYPDTIPELIIKHPGDRRIINGFRTACLLIDAQGKILDLVFPDDSIYRFEPLVNKREEMRFGFLEGKKIKDTLIVPVQLEYYGPAQKKSIRLHFPVSQDIVSNKPLLEEFFDINNIRPPAVIDMPQVNYKVDRAKREPDYVTVTALVYLDENGELLDLTYPIPGQDQMTHQVHVALINAEFEPARINDRPFACNFFLTFRIFDNIKYPFSPFQLSDSTRTPVVTEKYFMTRYFNHRDISVPALPRRFASGTILSPEHGPRVHGWLVATVGINVEGEVSFVSASHRKARRARAAREVLMTTTWYPAIDWRGDAKLFSGKVRVEFNQTRYVVYIPEWIEN
jgi:hypothetical protein